MVWELKPVHFSGFRVQHGMGAGFSMLFGLLPVPSSGFRVQHGVGAVQHSVWVLLPLPFMGCLCPFHVSGSSMIWVQGSACCVEAVACALIRV